MSPLPAVHAFGPVHWSLLPYSAGGKAEPQARAWLADRLGRPAEALSLQRDARGRPCLGEPGLDCNWSHSGIWLLVAVASGARLGVDVEALRPRPRALALAERWFAPAEAAWLRRRDAATRETDFVRLWCAKEAVLKAHGHGLAFGLQRLEFAEVDGSLALTRCDPALGTADAWTVSVFAPAPALVAAIAWRAPWSPAEPASV